MFYYILSHLPPFLKTSTDTVSDRPNEQKLFYWLLYNYRERQQENYNPTLTHSISDYHHVNQTFAKKVSTRQFSQAHPSGHKRSVSRFTVISNVAETEDSTENGTIKSYDPYKSSAVMQPAESRPGNARVVVHRNNPNVEAEVRSLVQAETMKAKASSVAAKKKANAQQTRGSSAHLRVTRGSMSSIRSTRSVRSIGSKQGVRPVSRHKRGVDFSRVRKPSMNETEPMMSGAIGDAPHEAPRQPSPTWNEDLSDFSCRIAKDLDDAFMSSLLAADSFEAEKGRDSPFSLRLTSPEPTLSPVTETFSHSTKSQTSYPWDLRPLPPSPPRSDSVQLEILRAMADQPQRKSKKVSVADVPHKDKTAVGVAAAASNKLQARIVEVRPQPEATTDRRSVSAPVYSQAGKAAARPLPSIRETGQESWPLPDKDKQRAVSAPSKNHASRAPKDNESLTHLAQAENTIRLVVSPSATRPKGSIAAPIPLNFPEKARTSQTSDAKDLDKQKHKVQQRQRDDTTRKHNSFTIYEEYAVSNQNSLSGQSDRASVPPARKSWFKWQPKSESARNSMVQDDERPASQVSFRTDTRTPTPLAGMFPLSQALSRKKSFHFPFWKTSKSDSKLPMAEEDGSHVETGIYIAEQTKKPSKKVGGSSRNGSNRSKDSQKSRTPHTSWYEHEDDSNARKIEPQQNWLSRLFRVKPATRHLCLTMSQRRARQEIVVLLREWRVYGIRNIEVDKERNIVFAKVDSGNCKSLPQLLVVSFVPAC